MDALWEPRVLREYSFIADGVRGALIGPRGEISWMCMPGWDGGSVFGSLLGAAGGFAVTPADDRYVWGGHYEPGSLIWRSRWVTRSVTECREALAMPGDPHRAVLLRRVEALDGPAKLRVLLDVRAGFGRHRMTELVRDRGCWTGRSGALRFRLTGAARARPDRSGQLAQTLSVPAGGRHDLMLEISDQPFRSGPPDPVACWQGTQEAWAAAVPGCDNLIAVRDARQAYAVLTGLTSGTGAMVAAATTSLPERLGGVRNYDYRYAWIRDQCYAGLAVAGHGSHPLLTGTTRFITERVLADGPDLRPAYTVTGGRIPAERNLRLPGYPGGTVRVGNRVNSQFQLDALGEVLQLLAAAARLDQLGPDEWRAAETAVAVIAKRRAEPDAGIWELDNQRWAHSRLTCASGLRAMAAAAAGPPGGYRSRQAAEWTLLADQIMADLGDCVHPSGRWQRSRSDERVDAALLLPAVRGRFGPADPRERATVSAVAAELAEDGYVYRFRQDARPLHEAEGSFLLCGFWMAQAVSRCGDDVAAAHWFERSRSACGPAGLYTEEYDVHQRQLRGNVPQAFVHAGMLEAAVRLSAAGQLGS